MTEREHQPVTFVEDDVPTEGIGETIDELTDLYGGSVTDSGDRQRVLVLPLRRGVATAGGVECTVSWDESLASGTVTMTCSRDVDASKAQRVMLLIAGVAGALMFMLWPFYPGEKGFGTLAWLGGAVAIAVYLMTLRKSSGGIASDFLRRLVDRQRAMAEAEEQGGE